MANYNLGNYSFETDPEIQKMIDEQMRRNGQMPEYTSSMGATDSLPKEDGDETAKMMESLYAKLKNQGADKEKFQADRKQAGEDAGPEGYQKGAGYIAAALQGMATGGKDLSMSSNLQKGWREDQKKAMDGVKDPSADAKAQLDSLIKMKAMERADAAPGERKELKQMGLDEARALKEDDRTFQTKLAGQKADIAEKAIKSKPSEGTKTLDREFAKDYNDWNSTGKAALEKNMAKLQRSRELLDKSKDDFMGTSGRFEGAIPDIFRSEQSKNIREDVHAAVQGALRATLGAQFTEKEGERIMKASYNENLSPEANLDRIDDAIKELEQNASTMDSRSSYFKDNKTLNGWSPEPVKAVEATKEIRTKMVDGVPVKFEKVEGGWKRVR